MYCLDSQAQDHLSREWQMNTMQSRGACVRVVRGKQAKKRKRRRSSAAALYLSTARVFADA